jgi:beta-galactosidase
MLKCINWVRYIGLFCTLGWMCMGVVRAQSKTVRPEASAVLLQGRAVIPFDAHWKFFPGDDSAAHTPGYDDARWRVLDLPHDWSIEGPFSKEAPSTIQEGALPTGIGWYRKSFSTQAAWTGKEVYIDFDGVYCNSEVWINGHYLGKRPSGYSSFRYILTPYLNPKAQKNTLAVRVDDSAQPDSRFYTGSGIYRHVRLVVTGKVAIDHWGVFVSTPSVSAALAQVRVATDIRIAGDIRAKTDIRDNTGRSGKIRLVNVLLDRNNRPVGEADTTLMLEETDQAQTLTPQSAAAITHAVQFLRITRPELWSVQRPYLYRMVTTLLRDRDGGPGQILDKYETAVGIRNCHFDNNKGFFLNGQHLKILGVCLHQDLGALGAAVNTRAMERRLELLKAMGCNAIRTAHNPPAPEFLDLCDRMGFLVMDEAFDMWKKKKNKNDYHLYWDQWHTRDLEDMVKRDRNHPSVFIWSIGNEIREQFDSTGITIARELVRTVKSLDTTRPVTSALSESDPHKNFIYQSGALDLVGLNYHQEVYAAFRENYPGQSFIGSENVSGLASRGHYDMPSDSVRYWPPSAKIKTVEGNPGNTVSAYDNVTAYWGSTHESTWNIIRRYDFLSGMFVWSGFDYLGEPTPYGWPSRSSYFGIIDLAGFPKDVYYMYQSEWTTRPVLHIMPRWNWRKGQVVDVCVYYNEADEVELFLNNRSMGRKKKQGDTLHLMWRLPWEAGTLRAVSYRNGKPVMTTLVKTAGPAAGIELKADRSHIKADGNDLSFITVRIVDAAGNIVPDADNPVRFKTRGQGRLAGVDNGYEASLEPFQADRRKAYNGQCLAIVRSTKTGGPITIVAQSPGLRSDTLNLKSE